MQLPLPGHIDQDAVIAAIDAAKDVDGLTAESAGLLAQGRPGLVPCTAQGVMELLRHAGVEPEGAEAVVVGRSILVGRPLASLLLNANATVTVCHSRTRDLAGVCRRADILVAAVGSPRLVRADWVKPGATVIDVGVNRTEDGLVGDVDFERRQRGRRRDHAGAWRGRADDHRDAAPEHALGRQGPLRVAAVPYPTEARLACAHRKAPEAGRIKPLGLNEAEVIHQRRLNGLHADLPRARRSPAYRASR